LSVKIGIYILITRPAAAVIPALIAYINVVDVKKLVVEGPAFGSVWEAVGLGKTILSVE